MKHTLKIAGLFLALTLGFSSEAKAQGVYLGNTWDTFQCSYVAGSRGFPYYQFGGQVGGVMVYNACFGLVTPIGPKPPTPPTTGCNKENVALYSGSLELNIKNLQRTIEGSPKKELYVEAEADLISLLSLANEMNVMAQEKNSCRLLTTFFLDELRPVYQRAEAAFKASHHQALDPKVGAVWLKVEDRYRKIRSNL